VYGGSVVVLVLVLGGEEVGMCVRIG